MLTYCFRRFLWVTLAFFAGQRPAVTQQCEWYGLCTPGFTSQRVPYFSVEHNYVNYTQFDSYLWCLWFVFTQNWGKTLCLCNQWAL